jgi:hypothetical protein
MQWYMSQGRTLKEIANSVLLSMLDNVPNSVHGKTISILIDCWKYGKDLQLLREEERPFQ